MTRKLDRLNASNSQGLAFQRLWQKNCETVEANNDDLQGQINTINDILSRLTANEAATAAAQSTANTAQSTASTAQSTANTAQSTASTVKRDDKITASSIIPADVLSASDAGSSASIVIAAHTRLYGDGSTLPVSGHTFTGLSYDLDYGIYYDDTTCSDTTPTYHTTTTLSHALNNFVAGRHFVGTITTPASGAAATSGGTSPPGTAGTDRDKYSTL